jgi:hypothetical protein
LINSGPFSSLRLVDSIGALLSIGCALHCLALFTLFGVLPFLNLNSLVDFVVESLFFSSSWGPARVYSIVIIGRFEWVFLAVSIVMALASVGFGYRRHGRRRVLIVLGLGVGAVALAGWLNRSGYQMPLLVAGALIVGAAQLTNRRFCAKCSTDGSLTTSMAISGGRT